MGHVPFGVVVGAARRAQRLLKFETAVDRSPRLHVGNPVHPPTYLVAAAATQ